MSERAAGLAEQINRIEDSKVVTVGEVVDYLEYVAPPDTANPVEPYGLQAGAISSEVKHVLVSATASFNALGMAAARKDSLLLTAAPLITTPMASVRTDDPIGGKLAHAIQHKVSLYALPNSFAAAPGGFDDCLAETLGLMGTSLLAPTTYEKQFKLSVFVPQDEVSRVMQAAAEAGAGRIGNYSHCSFETQGTGTFLGAEGAKPAIGDAGRLERVSEIKLEMIVPQRDLAGVIAAVLEVHSYEEVAYDVYPIRNPGAMIGRGRIGDLPLPVSLDTILAQVQDALGVDSLRCSHRHNIPVATMAAASGAHDGLVWNAIRSGAGALVLGSVTVKDLMLAESSMTVLIDVGYSASLAPGLKRLCRQLSDTFASDGVEVLYCP